eukprot:PhM_4_TR9523/c3_g1_i1/m.83171
MTRAFGSLARISHTWSTTRVVLALCVHALSTSSVASVATGSGSGTFFFGAIITSRMDTRCLHIGHCPDDDTILLPQSSHSTWAQGSTMGTLISSKQIVHSCCSSSPLLTDSTTCVKKLCDCMWWLLLLRRRLTKASSSGSRCCAAGVSTAEPDRALFLCNASATICGCSAAWRSLRMSSNTATRTELRTPDLGGALPRRCTAALCNTSVMPRSSSDSVTRTISSTRVGSSTMDAGRRSMTQGRIWRRMPTPSSPTSARPPSAMTGTPIKLNSGVMSLSLFCIGVPVRHQRASAWIFVMALAALVTPVRIWWASSSTTRAQRMTVSLDTFFSMAAEGAAAATAGSGSSTGLAALLFLAFVLRRFAPFFSSSGVGTWGGAGGFGVDIDPICTSRVTVWYVDTT